MKRGILIILSVFAALFWTVPVLASVNDFTISDYQIDYYLDKDGDGRSTLRTVEKITAQFPDFDQNHGIERAIPKEYLNHPTSLDIVSVTDADGGKLNYSTYASNGNEVLRIGDADRYVHGTQTYVLTYAQRDVTHHVDDVGVRLDELFWDTNGTEWRVPISRLEVRLHLSDNLQSQLGGSKYCYIGFAGENERCNLTEASGVFTASATELQPHQNISLAIAFKPETFGNYQPSLWEQLMAFWFGLVVASSVIGFGLIAWLSVRWAKLKNRTPEIGTVVPEYIPPGDMSVTAAAEVIDMPRGVMTAQILDLAVRHYLKIIQTREKSTFKRAEYDLEIIKPIGDLKWEEQELLRDLFAGATEVGSKMSMGTLTSSTAFYGRVQNNAPDLTKRIRGEYALRAKDAGASKWFTRTGFIVLIISIVMLSPLLFVASIISFVLGATLWPLTDKGLELRRYLLGLKDYIGVAEAERLKLLQSPEGAAKVGETIDANNQPQLIKLYERVLPYAVLFGQEKQWNEQLGRYYESLGTRPDWYAGHNAGTTFNAAAFASDMSSFGSSASYASPSSSSSGGSSGGGSSGGGGGGGGGGGW